jgi:hypothetical protein
VEQEQDDDEDACGSQSHARWTLPCAEAGRRGSRVTGRGRGKFAVDTVTEGVNTGCVNTCLTAGVNTYQHLPKSGVNTPCTNSVSTLKREPCAGRTTTDERSDLNGTVVSIGDYGEGNEITTVILSCRAAPPITAPRSGNRRFQRFQMGGGVSRSYIEGILHKTTQRLWPP